MSAFGATGVYTQLPGSAIYKVAQDGFATFDVAYEGNVVTLGFPWTQGDISPNFPNCILMTMEVFLDAGKQCGVSIVKLHYEGKDAFISNPITAQNISIDVSTSQEPIETHPDFVTVIGGTPTVPLNDAIFDATTGEFLGFAATSQFAGIRSYLVPQEIYTYSSVETDYPSPADFADIGKIVTPTIPLPVIPTGQNWLNTGIRIQNIGNVYYRTQVTGMLSGPRAWNADIYGP